MTGVDGRAGILFARQRRDRHLAAAESAQNLVLMRLIDEPFLEAEWRRCLASASEWRKSPRQCRTNRPSDSTGGTRDRP